MLQNIILIILIIILLFFISNEKKINDLISKKYIKYLFILLIIYFIYQKYNFTIFVVLLLILIFLNVDVKDKIANNKFIPDYNGFKNLILESFSNETSEKSNSTNNQQIEPFKEKITKIKDLYENIKLEIKKLK